MYIASISCKVEYEYREKKLKTNRPNNDCIYSKWLKQPQVKGTLYIFLLSLISALKYAKKGKKTHSVINDISYWMAVLLMRSVLHSDINIIKVTLQMVKQV